MSKTLRFELRPIGKTLEHIERKGLIAQDERRADEYEKVKDIIDRYHKWFVRMCLDKLKLKLKSDGGNDSLEDYVGLASKTSRDADEDELLGKVKANLRKQIVNAFNKEEDYKELFKKELITKHLVHIAESEEEKRMIDNFGKFTTYFTGFHENRKNMYSAEEKSTAIAYRLINENLPIFYDNMQSFMKIAESGVASGFVDIETSYQEYLNVEHISEMFGLGYFTDVLTQEQIEVYNSIIGGRVENDVKLQGINEYVNLYNQQQTDKKKRLPLLKPLYKMILSDRVAISWLPEKFSSDEEVIKAINETVDALHTVLEGNGSLKHLLQHIGDYDLSKIYISNGSELTEISQRMFGQYDVFAKGIKKDICNSATPTKKEKADPELYDERINKLFKLGKSFSIDYLDSVGEAFGDSAGEPVKRVEEYFAQLGAYDRNDGQRINLFTQIEMARVTAADVLAGKHTDLNQSENDIKLIRDLLDAFKALQHFIKPLLGNGDEADKDNEFYAKLCEAWGELDMVTPLYKRCATG
nr:type V CRISPR-associated protein Cas12a/Cpf1 [Xylanibacter muris]